MRHSPLLIACTVLGFAGCATEYESDEPLVESAMVDFGSGPSEVFFEEIEGLAVYEGDIILGPIDEIREGTFQITDRSQLDPDAPVEAAGLAHLNSWPNGRIPYVIGNVSAAMRSRIEVAINNWNSQTLVNFVEAEWWDVSRVKLVPYPFDANLCLSPIGRVPNSVQYIYLGDNCNREAITHELGHSVGFFHEQSRTDRDQHVVVNYDNIPPHFHYAFYTYLQDGIAGLNFGPYDIRSLMHYPSYLFAEDPNIPTIVPVGCNPNVSPLPPGCEIPAPQGLSSKDRIGATRLVAGDPPIKFQLRNDSDNRCLRPRSGSRLAGADVVTSACSGTSSRRWHTWGRPNEAGEVFINSYSNLCLQSSATNRMIQMPCTGTANQRFIFRSSGFLLGDRIQQSNADRCLRRDGTNNRTILSSSCRNTATRRWKRQY